MKKNANCTNTWRIKTEKELRQWADDRPLSPLLLGVAGRAVVPAKDQPKPGFLLATLDSHEYYFLLSTLTQSAVHNFVDTGTRRSWCKTCDHNGRWDFNLGCFVPE